MGGRCDGRRVDAEGHPPTTFLAAARMMEKTHIGIVGLGGHGRTIQRAADAARNLQVAAVFDLDEAEAQAAARRFGCAAAASSYEALLARDGIEAVVLVTPNHLHRPQAEAALEAGKHVLVEKPIANTVADGRAMIEAAEKAGCVLMVGHNMRRGRAARLARRMIGEGRLGRIVSIDMHFSADNMQRLAPETWRLHPDQCPLLPMMQLGIHAIDLVHYLAGPVDEVAAHTRAVFGRQGVVDSVTATFRTEQGPLGTLVSNYCSPITFQYCIAGTEGLLRCTPHTLSFRRAADTNDRGETPEDVRDFTAHDLESFILQMEAFGEAVHTGKPPETDGWAGLRALSVVEAMQQAAETKASQPVPRFEEIQAPRP